MDGHPVFEFDNSFAREMEGFYILWNGDSVPDPKVLRLNRDLARSLGLDPDDLCGDAAALALCGAQSPKGAVPLAMAYAGHQFGGFSPQLGDGRAILLGEIVDVDGRRVDLHLKGSGRTPFSRGGDGKAVLGPVLREYLFGNAMYALGVPTTRALAAVTTGEKVLRDGYEQGAVLARIAASHLRVGTFQFFAARGETDNVRKLADYAIARHFPDLVDTPDRYIGLFRRVRDRQAALVAQWGLVGFVHGVMNTDNTTISGETIDYGPCAFIDQYDPAAVFSSIDRTGRYAFGAQPAIMQWNLSRFAETLIHLVDPEDEKEAIRRLTEELGVFAGRYQAIWLNGMRAKLGLHGAQANDADLVDGLLEIAAAQAVDFTKMFRRMSDLMRGNGATVRDLFGAPDIFDSWVEQYQKRLEEQHISRTDTAEAMDRVNPIYIPRNHLVEDALQAAASGDMAPFDRLEEVLSNPFQLQNGAEAYAEPAPDGAAPHVTFCGT